MNKNKKNLLNKLVLETQIIFTLFFIFKEWTFLLLGKIGFSLFSLNKRTCSFCWIVLLGPTLNWKIGADLCRFLSSKEANFWRSIWIIVIYSYAYFLWPTYWFVWCFCAFRPFQYPHREVRGTPFTIGQNRTCDLVLNDPSISGTLCKLKQLEVLLIALFVTCCIYIHTTNVVPKSFESCLVQVTFLG